MSDNPTTTHRPFLERVEHAARVIDPVFLHTPQFVCEPLGEELGVRLPIPQAVEDLRGLVDGTGPANHVGEKGVEPHLRNMRSLRLLSGVRKPCFGYRFSAAQLFVTYPFEKYAGSQVVGSGTDQSAPNRHSRITSPSVNRAAGASLII